MRGWLGLLVVGACAQPKTLGEPRWTVELSASWAPVVACDPAGDVVVTGTGAEAWLAKLSGRDGSRLWTVASLGGGELALDVAVAGDGRIAVATSSTVAEYDASGQLLWRDAPLPATAVAFDGAGNLYALGDTPSDIVLTALDAAGAVRWTRAEAGRDGHLAAAGDRVALAFVSYVDPIVEVLTADGAPVWSTVAPVRASGIALAAQHAGGVLVPSDGALVELDATGRVRWTSTWPHDRLEAATAMADGHVIVGDGGYLAGYAGDGAGPDVYPWGYGNGASDLTSLAPGPAGSFAFSGTSDAPVQFAASTVEGAFVGVFDAPP